MEIIIENLTVKYTKKKFTTLALYNLNLKIASGEFFVVLGESGSGKSTLLNCLANLNVDYEGTIYFDKKDILEIPTNEMNIGYVTQDYRLYPNLTIFDNIAFPLRNAKVPAEEIRRRVANIADILEISHLLTRKPKVLSGGQQQRVALARALVKNPNVCLFDEPFSNLDENTRLEFGNLLLALHEKFNTTFVYVTHNVLEAFKLGSMIAILKSGELVQKGRTNEIYKQPKDDYVKYLFCDLNFKVKDLKDDDATI